MPYILCLIFLFLCAPFQAHARGSEADPRTEDEDDIMHVLARQGLHDFDDETWNFYGQSTYISQWMNAFPALYTNLNGSPNSLKPNAQNSFSWTATLFFGAKVWDGGEIYAVPEVVGELPLSGLKGLGGDIQNFELQKAGSEVPIIYLARGYFKQSFDMGGDIIQVESDPLELGKRTDSRRFSFVVGKFSLLDFFDHNSFAGDLRRQFFNMSFMASAAYDFSADSKGYTFGSVLEQRWDSWAFRYGRTAVTYDPNQLILNYNLFQYYGDQAEIEHAHEIGGMPGAIRILGFHNHEYMGKFSQAIAIFETNPQKYNATTCTGFNYGNPNAGAPDLCWARKPNDKFGIGINIEQMVSEDLGFFARGFWNDGNEEVYSYTSTDRSISVGGLLMGERWERPKDSLGIGFSQNWISKSHARYLALGGIDGFIGDGGLSQATEHVVDIFYSINVANPFWVTADYQHIANPGYNSARGPVNIFGVRAHIEF
jgi:high affinity Mn2+ porin